MSTGYDGSIKIDTRIDSKGFNKGINDMQKGLDGVTRSLKDVAMALGIVFGVGAIVSFGKKSSKMAMQLEANLQRVSDIFGEASKSIVAFTQANADMLGMSQATAYKYAAIYGNLFSTIIKDGQTNANVTQAYLQTTAVVASKTGRTMEDVAERIRSGLLGNTEAIEDLGINVNIATIEMTSAFQQIADGRSWLQLNGYEQQQVRMLAILEQATAKYGNEVAINASFATLQFSAAMENLKTTIGTLINVAIVPAIQMMTRFINTINQVIGAVFGTTAMQQEAMASSQQAIASSSDKAAKSEDKLAKATEKANKAAKGALSNFDELNVLQKDIGKSDASADSTVGNIDTTGMAGGGAELMPNTTLSPTVQQAVDLLHKLLEPLQAINLDNLSSAFNNLKESLTPITQALFAGLEWAYFNLFVPLATWTIENVLPLFLDMLSSAAKILTDVLIALQPLAMWLWENFLQPLAQWTGGIIVSVLGLIADALKKISDWMSQNKELVAGMATTVAIFFGAWELVKLMAFIETSGGIAKSFAVMTKAIKDCTIAKVIDKGETIYLTALYAKDFVLSLASSTKALALNLIAWGKETFAKIASTAAQITHNAIVTAGTAITWLATAATTAFSAAMAFLTSPIGLVVIAITALIAIVVVCIKHWDEIKEAGSKAWEAIKTAWSVASNWFDTNVVKPIAQFFTNLWDGIKQSFTTAWDFMSAALKEYINGWIGIVEGFLNFFINGINLLIDGLNTISFSVPDWVPGIGGSSWGINISNIPDIKIPRLATGAVIPPGAEFLAVLGDQKNGRNLEAPEGLIRQIVREESGGNGDITINFTGSLSALARVLKVEIDKESRRVGGSLVQGVR